MGFRVVFFLLEFKSILVWRHFLGKAFESTGGLGLDISRIFLSISDSLLRVSVANQISPSLRKFLCSYFFWGVGYFSEKSPLLSVLCSPLGPCFHLLKIYPSFRV